MISIVVTPSTEFKGYLVAKCELLDRRGVVSLHLLQQEGTIPIVIEGDTRLVTEYIGAVLLLHYFDLVVENLSPPDATKQPSHITWLLVNTQHITIIHRSCNAQQLDLSLALLDRCTWPTRIEGRLSSRCVLTTTSDTRTVLLTEIVAGLARYMSPDMALKVLSHGDKFDNCKADAQQNLCEILTLLKVESVKFVTCPRDAGERYSVRAVLEVADPNNLEGEVAILSGRVTHVQLLEDDNSPAVYSLDYKPQR